MTFSYSSYKNKEANQQFFTQGAEVLFYIILHDIHMYQPWVLIIRNSLTPRAYTCAARGKVSGLALCLRKIVIYGTRQLCYLL